MKNKQSSKQTNTNSTFPTGAAPLAFIWSHWIQGPELKSWSGRRMFLPYLEPFIHCSSYLQTFSFFFLSNWMHLVSVCKEPSDSSSVQTFPFINLFLGSRCPNWTRSYSTGVSNAVYRVGIVAYIPAPYPCTWRPCCPLSFSPSCTALLGFMPTWFALAIEGSTWSEEGGTVTCSCRFPCSSLHVTALIHCLMMAGFSRKSRSLSYSGLFSSLFHTEKADVVHWNGILHPTGSSLQENKKPVQLSRSLDLKKMFITICRTNRNMF